MRKQIISDGDLGLIINAFKNDLIRISFQDVNGNLLYISKKLADEFGHTHAGSLEKKHYSILQGLLANADLSLALVSHQRVIRGESIVLMVYSSFTKIFYLQTNTPVWDTQGDIIAEQSVYCPISPQIAQQLYRNHYLDESGATETSQPIILTKGVNELQELIIFLLLTGKTQCEIAEILDYSRSNIAKNIAILCTLFEIESKEKALIDYCLLNGYNKFIPGCLLERKIMALD